MVKGLLTYILCSLFAVTALAQDPPPRIYDEGTLQGVYFNLDFIGAGVTCASPAPGRAECTIPGGTTYTAGTNLNESPAGTFNVDNPYVGNVTGNASTATALAANGANCSAGSYPLGVDASGAVESCTDATTEIDSAIATHTADPDAHQDLVTLAGSGTYLSLSGQQITQDALTLSDISDYTVPTLQAVTTAGASSTNALTLSGANVQSGGSFTFNDNIPIQFGTTPDWTLKSPFSGGLTLEYTGASGLPIYRLTQARLLNTYTQAGSALVTLGGNEFQTTITATSFAPIFVGSAFYNVLTWNTTAAPFTGLTAVASDNQIFISQPVAYSASTREFGSGRFRATFNHASGTAELHTLRLVEAAFPLFSSDTTLTNLYQNISRGGQVPSGTTVTNRYGYHAEEATGVFGTLTNNYGYYAPEFTLGTNKASYFAADGGGYHMRDFATRLYSPSSGNVTLDIADTFTVNSKLKATNVGLGDSAPAGETLLKMDVDGTVFSAGLGAVVRHTGSTAIMRAMLFESVHAGTNNAQTAVGGAFTATGETKNNNALNLIGVQGEARFLSALNMSAGTANLYNRFLISDAGATITGGTINARTLWIGEPPAFTGAATIRRWALLVEGDTQINSDKQFILGGNNTTKEDNYFTWNSGASELQTWVGGNELMTLTSTAFSVFGVAPQARPAAYTITNGIIDRAYDANASSVAELADVLYTLIEDLKGYGFLQ